MERMDGGMCLEGIGGLGGWVEGVWVGDDCRSSHPLTTLTLSL